MLRRFLTLAAILTALAPAAWATPRPVPRAALVAGAKLDRELRERATSPRGKSRVILRLNPGIPADAAIASVRGLRGIVGRRLPSVGGQVAEIPDTALDALARLPGVNGVSLDRRVHGTMERTGATIGATWVQDTLGLDGTGVGIAVIDSGVANWHDDLGPNRVARFVDFVNFLPAAYDDYGHGTHVAGILAGDGHDSGGKRRGVAPGATLLVEKVLDATGQGYISNVIAAIDYAIANKDALHLRIVNLSVAAGVYESYTTDPLTLAAKRAGDAGLIVVSAAGNLGKGPDGKVQYGAIGAPGNAPWVITVGASSHNGTVDRSDDTIAPFSSRGPTALDFQAKPDLVAPGVGIESLTEAGSTLYNTRPLMRLWGTVPTANEPYLSMSGTSMASPVVSGTIALMLQANPALTPNLVKAILQYTAESHEGLNALTQGAGFLNARGAVELAQSLAPASSLAPRPVPAAADTAAWSGQVIWGNRRMSGGHLRADANAWATDVMWGSTEAPGGAPIAIGTAGDGETTGDNIVWGTGCAGADCENVVWSATDAGDSLVWGSREEGDAEPTPALGARIIVWDTNVLDETDNILWGAREIRRRSRLLVTDPALR
jgi:serine protease AprX